MLRRRRKPAKPKRVSYELIARDDIFGAPMYSMLRELVAEHHHELRDARIALAWCTSWKSDADGRITLGKCKKASDLDRELAAFDFVILLSRLFWRNDAVADKQRRALLDHELMHAAVKHDDRGEPARDERDRIVYRIRKHDLEEFSAIVERYGTYTRDLETFAAALRRAAFEPFESCEECRETPGWVTVKDDRGFNRKKRCRCWIAWSENRKDAAAELATEKAASA